MRCLVCLVLCSGSQVYEFIVRICSIATTDQYHCIYPHKWISCASQTSYLCLQVTISYNCTEVWEQLGTESQWLSRGREPTVGGQGRIPPEAGEVLAFKTLIFSTFYRSFHQINKHQPHFCALLYLMNKLNEQRVHLSICNCPNFICTRPAGHEKPPFRPCSL